MNVLRSYRRAKNMDKYTHLELDKNIEAPAGHYTPLKEAILKYNDREVLYILSQAIVDSSCCGMANYRYAIVPGYIKKWQKESNEAGLPVTEVDPVTEPADREEIVRAIRNTENITQIEFW